ncbi:FMRFamide-activated amiloride-sensitive sodium channel [Biomphalaria pfeifferi]|uniref:FMRFamide-activated amiloride-sensitive sodium channel n=1 Tax=Biomphalaria pfeifferi TaxID=112525 RepID=A0AAD8C088_BIOPF|nr:FMRFamide-activated amiloride-sensitive sodium channel [Biomphalaria pfeifferi]
MKYTSPDAKPSMSTSPHNFSSAKHRYQHTYTHSSQENDSHTVLGIIAELGSESNAHGLAKIVTSRDTKRKVIWALLVIIGFTAATLQLSLLVRKYLQFQVVELSEIKDSMPVEYPSVTVCNIEPISITKILNLQNTTKGQKVKRWLKFIMRFSFEQMSFIESFRAFYENLGDEAKMISHELPDLLIHCRFNREICNVSNFTTSFDGNYFNCFTFNGGQLADQLQMHATGPENGLSLIMSVEKAYPMPRFYGVYNFDNNILHSAGIRVVVHAPGSMPSPVDHGIDIPPGYSSSVGLKALLHSRLPAPYGNCTVGSLQGMRTYRNTFFACLQLCKQRLIMSRCGCKSSALPDLPTENVTFCGVIRNWEDIVKNVSGKVVPGMFIPTPALECEERMQRELNNDRAYEMNCQCFQPCSETSYLKSVSLSYWPLEFYQQLQLENILRSRNNTDKQHYMKKAYDILHNLSEEDRMHVIEKGVEIVPALMRRQKSLANDASDMVRQNLIRLNIYLEDLSVVEYRQLPAYGLADLFADIGGTLGLWMGISVLTIMELVELIIRLIGLMFNVERKEPRAAPVPQRERFVPRRKSVSHQPTSNGDAKDVTYYPDTYGPSEFDFRRTAEAPV